MRVLEQWRYLHPVIQITAVTRTCTQKQTCSITLCFYHPGHSLASQRCTNRWPGLSHLLSLLLPGNCTDCPSLDLEREKKKACHYTFIVFLLYGCKNTGLLLITVSQSARCHSHKWSYMDPVPLQDWKMKYKEMQFLKWPLEAHCHISCVVSVFLID